MRFGPTAPSRMPWGWLLAVVLALTPLPPAMAAGYLPNYEGLEPRDREMFKVVNNSDPDQVAALLKQGADVNARDGRGENVLLHAAVRNDIATMKVLLQAGASVDQATSWGRTALIAAAEDSAIGG